MMIVYCSVMLYKSKTIISSKGSFKLKYLSFLNVETFLKNQKKIYVLKYFNLCVCRAAVLNG